MKILCFGEILWDCLPHGNFLGGAPFNVAYHLKQLGVEPVVVSAVGHDEFGREALARIRARSIATNQIAEHADLPTGTVNVQLDPCRNASYVFTDPAAWDRINVGEDLLGDVSDVKAVVFGSLALRHEFNRASLDALLAVHGPLKIFDVNLRPPYDDVPLVFSIACRIDVLKLNNFELARLIGVHSSSLTDNQALVRAARDLVEATGCRNICVTCGEHGALWWLNGTVYSAAAPRVRVRDTIGAGDALTAALVTGLIDGEAQHNPQTLLTRACRLGAFIASCNGAQPDYDAAKALSGAS